MKIAAATILALLAALPFVVAPWIFLPLLAGVLVALPIYLGTSSYKFLQKLLFYAKLISVGAAVAIAGWFVAFTPWKPTQTSVASKANTALSRLTGESARPPREVLATLEVDRLSVRSALQMERQKVTLISRALAVYHVARSEYQTQANSGNPDEKLAAALKDFLAPFEKERTDANGKNFRLLAPEHLDAHLASAIAAIDKLEEDDIMSTADSQALRRFKLGIPNAINNFQLDQLYLAVTNLQDRLKTSLRIQLSPDSTYSAKYDRDTDSLITEQITRIRLSDNPASEIDLTGFFTSQDGQLGTNLTEEVRIQEDSFTAQTIQPKKSAYNLRANVSQLVISKKIIRRGATEPVIGGSLPLQFTQVRIDWPLPRTHAFTLALQERGNPNSTWPFVVSVENKDDASLSRILMPRYGVYFIEPAIDKLVTTASDDELTPSAAVGNVRALAPGSAQLIRIELLPRYLSNTTGQRLKEYLVVENIGAALILWIITVLGLAALTQTGPWGQVSHSHKR